MTRPLPPRPESIHGVNALQSYPDEALVLAEQLCRCGHRRAVHIEVWDFLVEVHDAACQECGFCLLYRPQATPDAVVKAALTPDCPSLDADIAAVRAGMRPEYEVPS